MRPIFIHWKWDPVYLFPVHVRERERFAICLKHQDTYLVLSMLGPEGLTSQ